MASNLAFHSDRRTPGSKRDFRSVNDRTLQQNIKALETSRTELTDINDFIRKTLNLPVDRKRSIFARVLYYVVPQRLYSSLPQSLVKLVAEEYDVLELIERLMRTNINNTQDALKSLAFCAIEKREQLDELQADIERARAEGWSAQQLQAYMAEKAQIQIYDEVNQLLDLEFGVLSSEEKEKRKAELLNQLESNIAIGQTLGVTLSNVCSASLAIFHRAVGQYFDYVNVYKPIAVIRDSAKTLTDMNQSMYAARDGIVTTFQASLEAIDTAVQAATLINSYAIASADIQGMLENGAKRINGRVKALNESKGLKPLSPVSPQELAAGPQPS